MPAVDLPKALESGKIDAFSMRNPFINKAKDLLPDKTIEFKETDLYIQNFIFTCRTDFLNENQQCVENIIKSLLEAEKLIAKDTDKAKELVVQFFGEDRKDEVISSWDKFSFDITLKQHLIVLLEDQLDFARHRGISKEDINFLDFIAFSPLVAEAPEKVTIIR